MPTRCVLFLYSLQNNRKPGLLTSTPRSKVVAGAKRRTRPLAIMLLPISRLTAGALTPSLTRAPPSVSDLDPSLAAQLRLVRDLAISLRGRMDFAFLDGFRFYFLAHEHGLDAVSAGHGLNPPTLPFAYISRDKNGVGVLFLDPQSGRIVGRSARDHAQSKLVEVSVDGESAAESLAAWSYRGLRDVCERFLASEVRLAGLAFAVVYLVECGSIHPPSSC